MDTSWLTVCGNDAPELQDELARRVAGRREKGDYSLEGQAYIRDVTLAVSRGAFAAPPARLELLRRLCKLHAVELRPTELRSHRPYVGRFIVAGKKALLRLVRPLLEPLAAQQREFNAAVVYAIADLCNEAETAPSLQPKTKP